MISKFTVGKDIKKYQFVEMKKGDKIYPISLTKLKIKKGDNMSKELKITPEAVLKASKRCPDAKAVLKDLFPDVFEEKELILDIGQTYESKYSSNDVYILTIADWYSITSHYRNKLWILVHMGTGRHWGYPKTTNDMVKIIRDKCIPRKIQVNKLYDIELPSLHQTTP